jgi:sulfatase maturation enzyme AslB (radical SAM superfamily)
MAYGALTAFIEKDRIPPSGILVTAVLPGGCPLDCPFCIVNQRDERRERSHLTTDHLVELLGSVERRGLLGGAAIVGDEPLQAHCWPMAKAFLGGAIDSKAPTALISNGYNLLDFVDELRQLKNTKILISLDAASEKHDEIRRRPGAFARISEGIRLASAHPDLRQRLSIATILMPGNLETISEIIDFTATNNIPQLLLSPLLTSSRTSPLAVHPRIMRDAWRALPALINQAESAGVKLGVSDEFAMLGPWEEQLKSIGLQVMSPKARAKLVRVDAAGRIETLESMRIGVPTELTLPERVEDIDAFVADRIIGLCMDPVEVAA